MTTFVVVGHAFTLVKKSGRDLAPKPAVDASPSESSSSAVNQPGLFSFAADKHTIGQSTKKQTTTQRNQQPMTHYPTNPSVFSNNIL